MPFLKPNLWEEPKWMKLQRMAQLNGTMHNVFRSDGDYYVGEWKDNFMHGKGRFQHLSRGVVYEGEFAYNYRQGYGCRSLKDPDGEYRREYSGGYCWNKRCGHGYRHYKDGGYYDGEFYNGKREGHGRMWYPDGGFYEGEWLEDKRHGEGLFIQPNFNRYEGEWRYGMKHGRGKFYHLDSGQVQEGIWVRDNASCSEMTDIQWRQAAPEPTIYPIQKHKLQDDEKVYKEAETHFLEKVEEIELEHEDEE